MIFREHYLAQIRPFYESDIIKIITGIRRCGKSVILRRAMSEMEKAGKRKNMQTRWAVLLRSVIT